MRERIQHFKWEPRGKRRLHKTPAQREIAACHYWLEQELSDIGPQVVVALGSTALKAVLEDPHARLQDYFGKAAEHEGLAVVATWHPSYALRAPDSETREHVYADIVSALAHASELAQRARSRKAR